MALSMPNCTIETLQGNSWPLLDSLVSQQRLGYLDKALAEHLLGGISSSNEDVAAFLCHLSMAAQQGHLCVSIGGDAIHPEPSSVWTSKGRDDKSSADFFESSELTSMIVQGAQNIGTELVAIVVESAEQNTMSLVPIYKVEKSGGCDYYFQRNWILETHFVKNYLKVLQEVHPKMRVDLLRVEEQVSALKLSGKLLEEQAHAILHGCRSSLTVITGGPGTGKTYTAGWLLRILWESLGETDRLGCKVVVTAPTGKAASHLEGSINRAMEGVAVKPAIKAQTLHALLGVKGHRQVDRHVGIDGDIIIVDESSMIDVWIMGDLMASIKPGARVILLGDISQLPSVESGSLFADIVSYHKNRDDTITHLKICQRAELKDIVDLAAQIDEGDVDEVLKKISWDSGNEGLVGVDLTGWTSPLQMQHALVKTVVDRYPLITQDGEDPLVMMQKFLQFRLLSPMREGSLGVDELNRKIYSECCKKVGWNSSFAVPIMITKNDYRMNVFNGDMGILMQPVGGSKELPFAYLLDRDGGAGYRKIGLASLPSYEYAYCLSVHKSQGSEFDKIALVVPQGADVFGREALYTAVTRARKSLEIWAHKETLHQMIEKHTKRHSGIISRLNDLESGLIV
jgi:exodeoxyribonuclease V alpha subunit